MSVCLRGARDASMSVRSRPYASSEFRASPRSDARWSRKLRTTVDLGDADPGRLGSWPLADAVAIGPLLDAREMRGIDDPRREVAEPCGNAELDERCLDILCRRSCLVDPIA